MSKKLLTIGQLAKQIGCKIELIRYYESIGLHQPTARTEGGNRLYNQEACDRLQFIRRSRELGFSIDEIRQLLQFNDQSKHRCDPVDKIVQDHIASIRTKIKDLKNIEHELQNMIARCPGGEMTKCSVVAALSRKKTK